MSFVDGNNYDLTGTFTQERQLTHVGFGTPPVEVDDVLHPTGVLARSNGTVTESDGATDEHWVGIDDAGRWYDRYVAADHGVATVDQVNGQ